MNVCVCVCYLLILLFITNLLPILNFLIIHLSFHQFVCFFVSLEKTGPAETTNVYIFAVPPSLAHPSQLQAALDVH